MKLDIFCERYSPHGNISGEGLSRILGTPTMNPLSVLVRETVQNSWDARLEGSRPRVSIRLRRLTSEQHQALRETVFASVPTESEHHGRLRSCLDAIEGVRVLEISDFGTSGLGGPSRAGVVSSSDEPTDFADFMRNIGSARDKALGGGTYGYGKSSLYRASGCSTIIVHTRSLDDGLPVERLMACQLAPQYTIKTGADIGHYTGRHWWGKLAKDGVIEPLDGIDASDVARSVGMPYRGADATGTTTLVLDPAMDGKSDKEVIKLFEQAILFNFWPKLARGIDSQQEMEFELFLDDEQIHIRDPVAVPPLQLFIEAYAEVKKAGNEAITVKCGRPKQDLGLASMKRGLRGERSGRCLDQGAQEIWEQSHHIALMRPAELIVRYLPGPRIEADALEYGGVFIAATEVEQSFAKSEPPAHDDWVVDGLDRRDATFVRVALRELRREMEDFVGYRQQPVGGNGERIPVGLLADRLGGLIVDGPGGRRVSGVRHAKKKGPKGDGPKRPPKPWRLSPPLQVDLELVVGSPAAIFEFTVSCLAEVSPMLVGEPFVLIEGGAATKSASGITPVVLRWQFLAETVLGRECRLPPGYQGNVRVAVFMPERCAVDLKVRAHQPHGNGSAADD